MDDEPTDTLTTIEAKVLCLRYGIGNIDENSHLERLHQRADRNFDHIQSVSEIARQLGEDSKTVEHSEISALRKLKLPK